jgi:SAP domain
MSDERPLAELTVKELKELARGYELPVGGKKSDLIARIEEYLNSDSQSDEEEYDPEAQDLEDGVDASDESDADADADDGVVMSEEFDDDEENVDSEVIGLLVRRTPRGQQPSDDDDIVLITSDDLEDVDGEDQDGEGEVYDDTGSRSDDDLSDDDDVMEFDDDASDEDDDDDDDQIPLFLEIPRGPTNLARYVSNFLLIVEAAVLVGTVIGTGDSSSNATLSEFLVSNTLPQLITLNFWGSILFYATILVALPTLVGLLMGKYPTPESVFGFGVARFAIFYLIGDFELVATKLVQYLNVRLFNVTSVVSVITAFWERQY